MRRYFTTDRSEQAWRKELVREMEQELRRAHPTLFTNELGRKLVMQRKRGMGWGTFVREGAVLRRGELVGAYFGHVGSRSGTYTASMEAVSVRGREKWEPAFDGKALVRARLISQAAAYNHSCSNATVYRKPFGSGKLRCALFFAKRRLVGGEQLVWNYGRDYVVSARLASKLPRWAALPCRCGPGRKCPAGAWLRQ